MAPVTDHSRRESLRRDIGRWLLAGGVAVGLGIGLRGVHPFQPAIWPPLPPDAPTLLGALTHAALSLAAATWLDLSAVALAWAVCVLWPWSREGADAPGWSAIAARLIIARLCLDSLTPADPLWAREWSAAWAVPVVAGVGWAVARFLDGPSWTHGRASGWSVPGGAATVLVAMAAGLIATAAGAWPVGGDMRSALAEAARIEAARLEGIREALGPKDGERAEAVARDRRLRAAVEEWLPLEAERDRTQAVVAAYSRLGQIPPREPMEAFAVANRRLGLFRERYEGVLTDLRAARRGHEAAARAYADLRRRLETARHAATAWAWGDALAAPLRDALGTRLSQGDAREGALLLAPWLGPWATVGALAGRPAARDALWVPVTHLAPGAAWGVAVLALTAPSESGRRWWRRGRGWRASAQWGLRWCWSLAAAALAVAALSPVFSGGVL